MTAVNMTEDCAAARASFYERYYRSLAAGHAPTRECSNLVKKAEQEVLDYASVLSISIAQKVEQQLNSTEPNPNGGPDGANDAPRDECMKDDTNGPPDDKNGPPSDPIIADPAGWFENVDWSRVGKAAAIGLCVTACTSMLVQLAQTGELDLPKFFSILKRSGLQGAVAGGCAALVNLLLQLMKPMLSDAAVALAATKAAAFASISESAMNTIITSAVTGIFSVVVDVLFHFKNNGWKGWRTLPRVILDSVISTLALIGATTAVAPFLPWLGTLAVGITVSLGFTMLRSAASKQGYSMITYLWRKIFPATIPTIPDWACCSVTGNRMTQPVIIRGYLCDRTVAEQRIRETQRDFWNAPATMDDIISMPLYKNHIDSYLSLHKPAA
jgi:hypothetical protein